MLLSCRAASPITVTSFCFAVAVAISHWLSVRATSQTAVLADHPCLPVVHVFWHTLLACSGACSLLLISIATTVSAASLLCAAEEGVSKDGRVPVQPQVGVASFQKQRGCEVVRYAVVHGAHCQTASTMQPYACMHHCCCVLMLLRPLRRVPC